MQGRDLGKLRRYLDWQYREWLSKPVLQRRVIEDRLYEHACLTEHCGAEWDPRYCPECGGRDDAHPEPVCSTCGHEWNPDICPACGKSEFHVASLPELLQTKPDGLLCLDCGKRWRELPEEDGCPACPACGSTNSEDTYPEIPSLADDPLLALVLAVEGEIPRVESGAVLHREMVSWLRLHGVRSRGEILTWEWAFRVIGAIRARLVEEMMAPPASKKPADDDREE